MFYTAIFYFLIYLACLATFLVSGYFSLFLLKNRLQLKGTFTIYFISLFFGLIVCVFTFSIIKARANTINLLVPVIFTLLFYKNKLQLLGTEAETGNTANKKNLLLAIVSAVILPFIYFCFVQFKGGTYYFAALDNDNVFYSHLSEQLNSTGLESRWQNYFGNNGTNYHPGPYHYFDLWLNALIIFIFPVKALVSLYLVTYPVLLCIGIFGLLAIVENLTLVKSWHLFLCLGVFLAGPLLFMRGIHSNFNTHACELPIAHFGEKFAVYYPFIFFTLLLLLNKKLNEALISLSLLAVASITILPALLVVLVFLLLAYRKTGLFKFSGTSFKVLVIFGAFFLFYYLQAAVFKMPEMASADSAYSNLNAKGLTLNTLSIILKGLYYFKCNYFYTLPLFLYFFQSARFKSNKHLLMLLFVPLAGLIAKSIFYITSDSYQLFTNSLPLFHGLVMVLILKLVLQEPKPRAVFYLITALLFINAVYTLITSLKDYRAIQKSTGLSDEYMLALTKLSELAPQGAKVAHFYTQEDFDRMMTTANANYLFHLAYTNFDALPVKLSCVNVSDFSKLLHDSTSYRLLNEQEAYYRYFYKNIMQTGQSPDRIKINFMRKNQLNYALFSPNAEIPAVLQARVVNQLTDSLTGIRFIALKP